MTKTFTPARPIWCAGCGHFGVQQALETAMRELSIEPHDTMVIAGIGCSGSLQNNIRCYGYHALHGRVLPTATGAKLANPNLTVIGVGGDGDGYAIGGGHLMHTLKRNPSLTYIVMNNGTYSLTKGQASPTSPTGYAQNVEENIDPMMLGLSLPGSTFLARGYTGQPAQLLQLMIAALKHAQSGRGFAYLEVLSPCVTYNDTYRAWRTDVYDIEQDSGYDPGDKAAAFARLLELRERGCLPIGLVYRGHHPALEAQVLSRKHPAPALQDINPAGLIDQYQQVLGSFMR
jgi:2-oxoglutarate/2-oxoacid ferredoxin oxidoreductase subunit beta